MAKQVKVFDVTAGTTATTVYTVPAGRVAKVILERYSNSASVNHTTGVITSGSFAIGSTVMPAGFFSGTDSGSAPVASTADALAGSIFSRVATNNSDGFGGTYTTYAGVYTRGFINRISYLPAGATITMTSASARFCVIEEF